MKKHLTAKETRDKYKNATIEDDWREVGNDMRRGISDFVRNASAEEKQKVFDKVIDGAIKDQQKVLDKFAAGEKDIPIDELQKRLSNIKID